jgi:hypothetical protein
LRIFSEVTNIRTVGNSTLLKIYTLPNHTITVGVCILYGSLADTGANVVNLASPGWKLSEQTASARAGNEAAEK